MTASNPCPATAQTTITRRARPARASVRLPPLDAESALALVEALERVILAVRRAHGNEMLDLLQDPPLASRHRLRPWL